MNVRSQRRTAWSSLVCCVLAQCGAAVWHPYLHSHVGGAHAKHEHHAHACAHSHACHTDDGAHEHALPASNEPCGTHNEHDCVVCEYMAIKWLAAPLLLEPAESELVTLFRPTVPESPVSEPHFTHFSRGPPAV